MDRRLRCCRIALVAAFALTGCSSTSAGTSGIRSEFVPALARANAVSPGNYIKHVIVIIQENRSFDNMFEGFPGAETKTFGYQSNGTLTPLRPIDITSSIDPAHGLENALVDYDGGKMDAFDKPPGNPNNPYAPIGSYAYAYIPRSEVAPYWSLARQYVLADHMFPSEWGGSFTAHLYLIAGTAELTPTTTEADNPFGTTNGAWGCDSPSGTATDTWDVEGQEQSNGPFPCFSQFNTMADLLDASGVSWKYYAPLVSPSGGNPGGFWSSFDAIANVRCGVNGPVTGPCTGTGGDWANVVSPETKVLTDITHGKLASVSWVVPDNANSDHPGTGSDTGPSWVASIVNAVGTSPYWKSTAIVVLWDDWGGLYDDLPPPQEDYRGLAIRVPCIIVSPYAKAHYVSHTQYEFGSVLKFIEQVFGLPALSTMGKESTYTYGYTDSRANSLVDSFDFTQVPRRFTAVQAKYPAVHFLRERPSLKAPDDD